MIDDVSNNLRVEEDDGEHGHEVGENENEKDEHFRLQGVGDVVKRATGQVALWWIKQQTLQNTIIKMRVLKKGKHSPGTNLPQYPVSGIMVQGKA